MVRGAHVSPGAEAHAPEVQLYQTAHDLAPAGRAEIGSMDVSVLLEVVEGSVVRRQAHRRVVLPPAREIGDDQIAVREDHGRERETQYRVQRCVVGSHPFRLDVRTGNVEEGGPRV